jgi:hypothetical protein
MRALLVAAAALLAAGFALLWNVREDVQPEAVRPAKRDWAALPSATPQPPANIDSTKAEPPPPQVGKVAGTSAPLPGQPDLAAVRAGLDRAKAVRP